MLYKVHVGRDEYLGTAEEVVAWMSKAKGAPKGGTAAFMRGIAERVRAAGRGAEVDVSGPDAFLASLADAGFLRLEERPEASKERVEPAEALGDGPIAYGKDVDAQDIEDLDLDSIDDGKGRDT